MQGAWLSLLWSSSVANECSVFFLSLTVPLCVPRAGLFVVLTQTCGLVEQLNTEWTEKKEPIKPSPLTTITHNDVS